MMIKSCLEAVFQFVRNQPNQAGSGIYKLLEKMAFSKLPHGELHDVSYLLRPQVV